MSDANLIEQFMTARKVGTPIISISTFDQEATMQSIQERIASGTRASETPIIQWDCVRGWNPRNECAIDVINLVTKKDGIESTRHPVRHLNTALELPTRTILFIINAHYRNHPSESYDFWQAIFNLREPFKDNLRTVVLLSPSIKLPPELNQDILGLDEKLPTVDDLKTIVINTSGLADVNLTDKQVEESMDALRGLPAFPAEQTVAMSLANGELDIDSLWERKRKMISDTPGLKVYSGNDKFSNLGGCFEIKKALTRVINGKEAPGVIVFIDEAEKTFAGATGEIGDNTGVSQDFLGTLLSYMEDTEADGTIFVGPPGAAKSAVAKTMGNEAGVPTIILDLGGMKASLLGESEQRLRTSLKIIDAVGGGKAYFIMTSNKITQLPPELKRRFTSGTYFFDLPSREERELIWDIYIEKNKLDNSQLSNIDDRGWTGAEIRNCCRMAYRQDISISEASKYIIPVSVSGAKQLADLRHQANGNYLSANYSGIFSVKKIEPEKPSTIVRQVIQKSTRKMDMDGKPKRGTRR